MTGPSKGRTAGFALRPEWTARLNSFLAATTPDDMQAVLENALQINPGGTLRNMLEAWGYSASGRGRKGKDAEKGKDAKPARERLETALRDVYGSDRNPVRSLYPKLAGSSPTSVRDAARIVAALIASWPDALALGGKTAGERNRKARQLGEDFVRELLVALSEGRSRKWDVDECEVRAFKLIDEERIGVRQFIREAGQSEGALIVAGARNILIGTNPVDVIRDFHEYTRNFLGDHGSRGLLIFVVDASIMEGGGDKFNSIYNIGLLSTAMAAFALLDEQDGSAISLQYVEWSRWRELSSRCCIVMRRPPLIDGASGALLPRERFDDFVASWQPQPGYAKLQEFVGLPRFDGQHLLPRKYPPAFDKPEKMSEQDLYWDVLVRPSADDPSGLDVQYFVPPPTNVAATAEALEPHEEVLAGHPAGARAGAGRPPVKTIPIEDDLFYVIRKASPGHDFDYAQRAIYMAARGRLNLDEEPRRSENLSAAAALRRIGYEVLPVATMLSLLPRMLFLAATFDPTVKLGDRAGN